MKKIIMWFRKDLRLHDNPALWEAALQGAVLPLFILSEEEAELPGSSASHWWLHHSLQALSEDLQSKGLSLTVRSGNTLEQLMTFINETDADALFFNERFEPSIINRDNEITSYLANGIVEVQTFNGHLLFPPHQILTKEHRPYKVFTSFWKRTMLETVAPPLPVPLEMSGMESLFTTLSIDDLDLLPKKRWDKKLIAVWQPGENKGINRWSDFSNSEPERYLQERDQPAAEATSSLSPYLANGDISVKALWHAANAMIESSNDVVLHQSLQAFLRQLIWREFAYHQLIHFPEIDHLPLRKSFMTFPWMKAETDFLKWKRGETGYPLVDAGMRELWNTGCIHNRVRMVVASFLVKHLLIPWTDGSDWFKETLVDFDTAINSMGWQWVTGCGIDSAPYFRIFNPILQSEKFDSKGRYIRKWVPELNGLPDKYIHKPWEAPSDVLALANITLGESYPLPIIDHSYARKRALEAYAAIKNNPSSQA